VKREGNKEEFHASIARKPDIRLNGKLSVCSSAEGIRGENIKNPGNNNGLQPPSSVKQTGARKKKNVGRIPEAWNLEDQDSSLSLMTKPQKRTEAETK